MVKTKIRTPFYYIIRSYSQIQYIYQLHQRSLSHPFQVLSSTISESFWFFADIFKILSFSQFTLNYISRFHPCSILDYIKIKHRCITYPSFTNSLVFSYPKHILDPIQFSSSSLPDPRSTIQISSVVVFVRPPLFPLLFHLRKNKILKHIIRIFY